MKLLSDKYIGEMLAPQYLKLIIGLALLVGIVSVGGLIALIVLWRTKLTPFQDYGVFVDAGPTRSTIFLYTWPADKSDGSGSTSRVIQVASCRVSGGAITSITSPSLNSTQQYFDVCMTSCINQIPSTRRSRALIFLGGADGLRLSQIQNASYTNDLLNSTRAYFSTLGLLFKAPENQVRIVNGSEEGLSEWISANILLGRLLKNNKPLETYGVSDMGVASTQLSFIAPNATNDLYTMNLFNTDYNVYSHSYLCYGTDQLRLIYLGQIVNKASGSTINYDPCLQNGYIQSSTYNDIFNTACAQGQYAPLPGLNTSAIFTFIGSGNSVACSAAVRERLNTSICTSTSCSFDNIYQPKPISPSLKFIATSGWWSTFSSLAPNVSLSPNQDGNYNFSSTTLTQIKTAIASICNQQWSDVVNPDAYRQSLCFNSMYHWTLFEYGYGMTDANLKNFQIVKTIASAEIDWTLGYMINQTNILPPERRSAHSLTTSQFIGLLFLCGFSMIVSVLIASVAAIYYRRR